VWGQIDDEGDGEPDEDDSGYEDSELHAVMQAWVLRRCNIRPLTTVPIHPLRLMRPFDPSGGGGSFRVVLDSARRLVRPNADKSLKPDQPPPALLAKCSTVRASTDGTLELRTVFLAQRLKLTSPTAAPEWADASGGTPLPPPTGTTGSADDDAAAAAAAGAGDTPLPSAAVCLLFEIFEMDGSADKAVISRLAWAVLPLFAAAQSAGAQGLLYLMMGRFQLPLYGTEGSTRDVHPPI
jgi:hypothetical protein